MKTQIRLSYLLRLWRTLEGDWRASLEAPGTGERQGFASLQALFEFLGTETEKHISTTEKTDFFKQNNQQGDET